MSPTISLDPISFMIIRKWVTDKIQEMSNNLHDNLIYKQTNEEKESKRN
jgi:hypothetical protein